MAQKALGEYLRNIRDSRRRQGRMYPLTYHAHLETARAHDEGCVEQHLEQVRDGVNRQRIRRSDGTRCLVVSEKKRSDEG
jgi:hypothetical protein